MENDAPSLPQEINRNILQRLPVKSLIRFQCVCKDWKNLFKTPSFIAEHLHHSTQQNPLLLVFGGIMPDSNHWYSCLLKREMQVLGIQNPPITNSSIAVVCSSNGLLCVEHILDSRHSFWLWNPSIRKVIQVPKSLYNYERKRYAVGFGFSPIVNDYKIVKLLINHSYVRRVEVYALRILSWRKVEFTNLKGVSVSSPSGFTCNGAVFWLGMKGRLNVIVSFDIAMEVFTVIPWPTTPRLCFDNLSMYENKHAMFFHTMTSESCLIHLWVLEESTDPSRERWSWTNLYTTRPNPYGFEICPLTIWRNEIVCGAYEPSAEVEREDYEEKVVLCNLTTDEFNVFTISKYRYIHKMFWYVESLVLLDNMHL